MDNHIPPANDNQQHIPAINALYQIQREQQIEDLRDMLMREELPI